MNVTIDVTQDDIDNGARMDPVDCPVAKAVERSPFFSNSIVSTWFRTIRYISSGTERRKCVQLPDVAVKAIMKFDREEGMHPFSFEVEVSDDER